MAGDGYDAAALAAGLKGRRVEVAARAARVLAAAASFGATLAADAATGALEANAPLRAGQLRDALASLGPSFVKVGVVSGGVVRVRVTFFQGEGRRFPPFPLLLSPGRPNPLVPPRPPAAPLPVRPRHPARRDRALLHRPRARSRRVGARGVGRLGLLLLLPPTRRVRVPGPSVQSDVEGDGGRGGGQGAAPRRRGLARGRHGAPPRPGSRPRRPRPRPGRPGRHRHRATGGAPGGRIRGRALRGARLRARGARCGNVCVVVRRRPQGAGAGRRLERNPAPCSHPRVDRRRQAHGRRRDGAPGPVGRRPRQSGRRVHPPPTPHPRLLSRRPPPGQLAGHRSGRPGVARFRDDGDRAAARAVGHRRARRPPRRPRLCRHVPGLLRPGVCRCVRRHVPHRAVPR